MPKGAKHKATNFTLYRPAMPLGNRKQWGAFDSAKNHKRQRRKRQSVTAK